MTVKASGKTKYVAAKNGQALRQGDAIKTDAAANVETNILSGVSTILITENGMASADRLIAGLAEATGTPLTVIGRIEGTAGDVVFVDADGAPVAMRGGFEHFHG